MNICPNAPDLNHHIVSDDSDGFLKCVHCGKKYVEFGKAFEIMRKGEEAILF